MLADVRRRQFAAHSRFHHQSLESAIFGDQEHTPRRKRVGQNSAPRSGVFMSRAHSTRRMFISFAQKHKKQKNNKVPNCCKSLCLHNKGQCLPSRLKHWPRLCPRCCSSTPQRCRRCPCSCAPRLQSETTAQNRKHERLQRG